MDEDKERDLEPGQLADLLGITFDALSNEGNNAATDANARLLDAQLVGILALDTSVLDNLPTVVGQLDKDIFGGGGETLGKVLTNAASDMETIKKIKRYAKAISSNRNSGAEHTVAVAVYYAAIANALAFHKAKITAHSYRLLKAEFKKLASEPWMSKELAAVFTEAAKGIS